MGTTPKKPTRPYGSIVFSKSGKVRKEMSQLPDDKLGQEAGVASAFLTLAAQVSSVGIPSNAKARMLPETDHDFEILDANDHLHATVQVAEVTIRSYTRPLSQEEYHAGAYREVIQQGLGNYLGVDQTKFLDAMASVVAGKLERHYAKPQSGELWLLLFSVSGHLLGSAWHGGVWHVAEPITQARKLIEERGAKPFDKVLFFNMQTRPELIWPPIDDRTELAASE